MIRSNFKKYWIDEKRLSDPMFWYMKAYAYASTCSFIWKSFGEVVYAEQNPELSINAIRSTPYLTGLACELFMKGYLVSKGGTKNVMRLRHNLKEIREACAAFGDKRFEDKDLKFLTDTCGEQLMENGGIRYPDKHEMLVFPEFKNALNLIQKISSEVSSEIMNAKTP